MKNMDQVKAERIASARNINYGPVTFRQEGRRWAISGYDCYDRRITVLAQLKGKNNEQS
jgi:hypothetical protein